MQLLSCLAEGTKRSRVLELPQPDITFGEGRRNHGAPGYAAEDPPRPFALTLPLGGESSKQCQFAFPAVVSTYEIDVFLKSWSRHTWAISPQLCG